MDKHQACKAPADWS